MPYRYPIAALLLIAATAWWLLHDSSEAEVRKAHATLASSLSKSGEDDAVLSLLQLRTLEAIFADACVVSGDAGGISGSYSPQQVVGLIVQVRSVFETIQLSFDELTVELPAPDAAVASFQAELIGQEVTGEQIFEVRAVETRMRRVDGVWQFTEIALSGVALTPALR